MNILLKDLLHEIEDAPLITQVYIDMDGVLVDMDGGFKKIYSILPKDKIVNTLK